MNHERRISGIHQWIISNRRMSDVHSSTAYRVLQRVLQRLLQCVVQCGLQCVWYVWHSLIYSASCVVACVAECVAVYFAGCLAVSVICLTFTHLQRMVCCSVCCRVCCSVCCSVSCTVCDMSAIHPSTAYWHAWPDSSADTCMTWLIDMCDLTCDVTCAAGDMGSEGEPTPPSQTRREPTSRAKSPAKSKAKASWSSMFLESKACWHNFSISRQIGTSWKIRHKLGFTAGQFPFDLTSILVF